MNLNKIQNSIVASIFADALSLPVHWIYDQAEIAGRHPEVKKLESPEKNPYHFNMQLGDNTHYGDQAVLLIQSISENQDFDLSKFKTEWENFVSTYSGYIDKATKATVADMENGSDSHDLGGAARIAGLLLLVKKHSTQELIDFARAQTKFTHNYDLVVDTAEFIMAATLGTIAGSEIEVALEEAAGRTKNSDFLKSSLEKAKKVLDLEPNLAISTLGLPCSVESALPASLYLVFKFKNDLLGALSANCVAGGDSAARGLVIGMLLGAAQTEKWEYSELIKMKSYSEITKSLAKFGF